MDCNQLTNFIFSIFNYFFFDGILIIRCRESHIYYGGASRGIVDIHLRGSLTSSPILHHFLGISFNYVKGKTLNLK